MDPYVPGLLSLAGATPRELETFWLVADRLHNKEIADRLQVSVRTVESHVSSLLRKLGGTDRQSLIRAAARLRQRQGPSSALPRPLTSFVGRGREVADVHALVAAHRMLTLIGPAGAGKTRSALHVAASAQGMPPPVLVDLAVLPPVAPVERAFADALGVAADERRLRAELRDALADEPHWLLVDNCEHVTAATASLLADLLAATTGLRILATSHGPLRVAGEAVYEIPPLQVPSADTDDPSAVLAAASGQLFAERAAAACPGFTITADNARAVATICRRLDGLPLAIELAAARTRLLSPAELVSHLDERFALLVDGARGAPGRHATLQAALSWSYQLLDDKERLLFERCSVFPADFDYDTAAGILAYPPLSPADFTRTFPRLLDRSLVSRRSQHQNTTYRMLDSVRQFAQQQLATSGGQQTLQAQHARGHLRRGAALGTGLKGRDQIAALRWFADRWADLRTAIGWALEHDETILAWEFLAGIGTGWEVVGAYGELFPWLDRLLRRPLPPDSLGVRSAVTTAFLLCYQDTGLALTYAEQAYAQARTGPDVPLARLARGWVRMYGEDRANALSLLRQAAAEFEALGDDWHYALALAGVGYVEPATATALAYLARSADLFDRLTDHVKRANCLNHSALLAIESRTHLDEAESWLIEAKQLAEHTGNHHERLHAELHLATLDQYRGHRASVGPRFGSLLAEFRRIGDRRCAYRCLLGLGRSALNSGDHEAARRTLSEAVDVATSLGEASKTATGLRLLAEYYHSTRQFGRAAALLGAADHAAQHLDRRNQDSLNADRHLRTALHNQLGPAALATALAHGRRTPLSQLLTDPYPTSGLGLGSER